MRERERERERDEATEEAHLGSDPAAGHRSRRLFGLRGDRDGGEGWGKWRGDGGGGGERRVGGAVLSACGRLELLVRNDAPTLTLSFCSLPVAHCLFEYTGIIIFLGESPGSHHMPIVFTRTNT
jgi:hypothetical protein